MHYMKGCKVWGSAQNMNEASGSQEEQKDVLDVSHKFREWLNIKFIKSRDNISEWRWWQRGTSTYNVLITGL